MKMRLEHYRELRAALTAAVVSSNRTLQDYLDKGLSEERYRWDMFYRCSMDGQRAEAWMCKHLYSYLNDNHVDTALRSILK